MRFIKAFRFYLMLGFINTFLKGTHFFNLKRKLLNSVGVKVGNNSKIVAPINIGRIAVLEIGENCWINRDFSVEGNGKVFIGNNCDIAPEVSILTGSHEIGDYSRRAGRGVTWTYTIGNGTWIGARTTILNNANIGNGVVIGAASLINKQCEDNAVYVGSPAKKIKELTSHLEQTTK